MVIDRVTPIEYRDYGEMFKEYINALCTEIEPYEEECFDWALFYSYWNDPNIEHYFVRYRGQVCGFISISNDAPVGADYHIVDAYIKPEYRRKGIGLKMAHKIQAKYGKRITLQVKWGNRVAMAFWERAFSEWHNVSDRYNQLDNEWCMMWAFEKF